MSDKQEEQSTRLATTKTRIHPQGPRTTGLPVRANAPWVSRSSEMLEKRITSRKRKDAFLPIITRLIERSKSSSITRNKFDEIFQKTIQKYPAAEKTLTRLVEDTKKIPQSKQSFYLLPTPAETTVPLAPISALNAKNSFLSQPTKNFDVFAQLITIPTIVNIQPNAPSEGYAPGQTLTINGWGFAKPPTYNKISLKYSDPVEILGTPTEYYTNALQNEPNKLTLALPPKIFPGQWILSIETKDSSISCPVPINIRWPMKITSISPPLPPGGYPPDLQEVFIEGTGFDVSENKKIEFFRLYKSQPTTTVNATFLSNGKLRFSLVGVPTGAWRIRVWTKDSGFSNFQLFTIGEMPANQPVVTKISVFGSLESQNLIPEPGQEVIIYGHNFEATKTTVVHWNQMNKGDIESYFTSPAEILNDNTLKTTIHKLAKGGTYKVYVEKQGALWSAPFDIELSHPKYRLLFKKIECLDESNWLGTEWGSDEIVTFWTINADTNVWDKHTGEYGGFDDGNVKNYKAGDTSTFKPDGSWGIILYRLSVVTKLYEWDWSGDIQAAMDFLGDLGKDLLKYACFGSEEIAEFLSDIYFLDEIFGFLCDVISWVASVFGADPDGLGTQNLSWSRTDLQWMLQPGQTYQGHLDFMNSADTGSYRLHYELLRKPNN